MITIEHTHAEGTLAAGASRGDGTARVIRDIGDGWRYSDQAGAEGAWFLPGTRDQDADWVRIERLADALRGAGYDVEVRVDDAPRTREEIESDRMVSPVDCVCSAWVTIPTFNAEFVPERDVPCDEPPILRMTIHHDGESCGYQGMCLLPDPYRDGEEEGSVEPWTEVRLLCADHAHEYRDGEQAKPGVTVRSLP